MDSPYVIILFYKFIEIENPEKLKKEQKRLCESLRLKGRMLIAKEGINATFEGKKEDIVSYKKNLIQNPLFKDIVFKESEGTGSGFTKLKIKVRSEVVTLAAGTFNVPKETAQAITAGELEALYANNDDFVILDLRNNFEVKAGYFEKTINPELSHFRDLPKKLPSLRHLKDKKIITVCTGGIRCEKATCLMKREGFTNLYQLKDGIHTYMKEYPGKRFKGSLFVFDNRMVTPVVATDKREIVGTCAFCNAPSEEFYNDDTVRPSAKMIVCSSCAPDYADRLRKCSPSFSDAL